MASKRTSLVFPEGVTNFKGHKAPQPRSRKSSVSGNDIMEIVRQPSYNKQEEEEAQENKPAPEQNKRVSVVRRTSVVAKRRPSVTVPMRTSVIGDLPPLTLKSKKGSNVDIEAMDGQSYHLARTDSKPVIRPTSRTSRNQKSSNASQNTSHRGSIAPDRSRRESSAAEEAFNFGLALEHFRKPASPPATVSESTKGSRAGTPTKSESPTKPSSPSKLRQLEGLEDGFDDDQTPYAFPQRASVAQRASISFGGRRMSNAGPPGVGNGGGIMLPGMTSGLVVDLGTGGARPSLFRPSVGGRYTRPSIQNTVNFTDTDVIDAIDEMDRERDAAAREWRAKNAQQQQIKEGEENESGTEKKKGGSGKRDVTNFSDLKDTDVENHDELSGKRHIPSWKHKWENAMLVNEAAFRFSVSKQVNQDLDDTKATYGYRHSLVNPNNMFEEGKTKVDGWKYNGEVFTERMSMANRASMMRRRTSVLGELDLGRPNSAGYYDDDGEGYMARNQRKRRSTVPANIKPNFEHLERGYKPPPPNPSLGALKYHVFRNNIEQAKKHDKTAWVPVAIADPSENEVMHPPPTISATNLLRQRASMKQESIKLKVLKNLPKPKELPLPIEPGWTPHLTPRNVLGEIQKSTERRDATEVAFDCECKERRGVVIRKTEKDEFRLLQSLKARHKEVLGRRGEGEGGCEVVFHAGQFGLMAKKVGGDK
ncbi:hypothetical protein BCR33DRAFT_724480 [Rhizoclosmatium globosum]|uniref:Uncharacterized protein n=1 Tax=Rhizoclosmatium globosum TaxID=329046 RepID=A0A1Y2B5R2_9FUNG|nr:hypothetical protein BCR33DRAFT_724480 [Rhizoclosmatium globosum]|eukprot:ORY30153.1 hypothetical protein BCR33DRAFT_724480 [Rhizoclosmatium globosum]